MGKEIDYFEQVEGFPDNKYLSSYNLKILFHYFVYFPTLISKGKYQFFKKVFHHILQALSHTSEKEIEECFRKCLMNNEFHNTSSLTFLQNRLVYPMMLYYAVRISKPSVVIETGIHSGRSSSFILQALYDNGGGKLYSLDLGHDVTYSSESGIQVHDLPEGIDMGWLVPEHLKQNWEIILGDSKIELPKLLKELGQIDFFCHDGEHTDSNMMFEYELAMEHLHQSGILMSDDVLFSQHGPKKGYLHKVPHYSSWLNFTKDKNNSHIIDYKVGYFQIR